PQLRQPAQPLAHLLAAAGDRLQRFDRRQLGEDVLDLVVDGRGQQAERLRARLLGREGGIRVLPPERRVQRARHLAQAPQARQESLRRASELLQGELPAVDRAGYERLQDPEGRLQRPADVRVPAAERRNVWEFALGQEPQELELRVQPRLQAPEDLQDQLLVEDDGRVGLLAL